MYRGRLISLLVVFFCHAGSMLVDVECCSERAELLIAVVQGGRWAREGVCSPYSGARLRMW